ncbi:DNA-directed RNA polymerase [Salmonella phage 21]|nr:DNA-directed RNA polymerase [Salmonella phage 21]
MKILVMALLVLTDSTVKDRPWQYTCRVAFNADAGIHGYL